MAVGRGTAANLSGRPREEGVVAKFLDEARGEARQPTFQAGPKEKRGGKLFGRGSGEAKGKGGGGENFRAGQEDRRGGENLRALSGGGRGGELSKRSQGVGVAAKFSGRARGRCGGDLFGRGHAGGVAANSFRRGAGGNRGGKILEGARPGERRGGEIFGRGQGGASKQTFPTRPGRGVAANLLDAFWAKPGGVVAKFSGWGRGRAWRGNFLGGARGEAQRRTF